MQSLINMRLPGNRSAARALIAFMSDGKVYDESTRVTAKDGDVVLDGPDGVDVVLTPEAADRTAEALEKGAAKATGQRRLRDNPHQPK